MSRWLGLHDSIWSWLQCEVLGWHDGVGRPPRIVAGGYIVSRCSRCFRRVRRIEGEWHGE